MTDLNIQSLAFLGYGVIIWQVFIRILRYYCTKALRFYRDISLAPWGEGVRRTGEGFVGGQSNVPHEIDCHPELVSGSLTKIKNP